jgi:hypothetical protein
MTCSRRKIRCDRGQPCSYCARLKSSCRYPEQNSEPSHAHNGDVLVRLDRIEEMLGRLLHRDSDFGHGSKVQSDNSRPPAETVQDVVRTDRQSATNHHPSSHGSAWMSFDLTTDSDHGEPQREGSSRADTDETTSHRHVFPFAPSDSLITDPVNLHPPADRAFMLWQTYVDRIDPLAKVLHIPNTQRQLITAAASIRSVPPAFESLMFAIYYAAIYATQASSTYMFDERTEILARLRSGLEQALSKANFLTAPELFSIQALVIFLICARHHEDKTHIWTLLGLTIRLAYKLNLHLEDTDADAAPYTTQLRRRLWWQIMTLDALVSEDAGLDPSIYEHNYTTKQPSAINDTDFDTYSSSPPAESPRRTEMLFALQRITITHHSRWILFSARFAANNGYIDQSDVDKYNAAHKLRSLTFLRAELDTRFSNLCEDDVPICRMALCSAQLVLDRMELAVYLSHATSMSPASALSGGDDEDGLGGVQDMVPPSTQGVALCISLVRGIQFLRSDDVLQKWTWLFQRYVEWDAMALLLHGLAATAELGRESVQVAWGLVKAFWDYWEARAARNERENRWRRLEALRREAEVVRGNEFGLT